ncbi:MAG: hypothetical protein M3R29_03615, partial [Verrucomicrobiota bacterium]|nr:hypothetical protein [Verrucomicrobiota bacterium]
FYVSLAFAFLAKGPIGLIPILTVTSTIVFLPQPELARRFKFLRGIALTLAIICLWGIPALIRTRGEFFSVGIGRHVIERSVSAMGGHGARSFGIYLLLLPFYFVTIFVSFFPWSLKLPWLARRLRRNGDPIDLYLLSGAAIIFAVFTFVTTKLLHYTLPAFPLLALLLARALSAENSTGFFKKSATAMAAVCLVITLIGPSFIASFFPSRELFRQSRDYLRPEMKFAAFHYKEPSLVWYFRSRVRGWMQTTGLDLGNIPRFMQKDGGRFIILPTEVAREIYPTLPDNLKEFSTDGFNIVKGKRANLTLILKPE